MAGRSIQERVGRFAQTLALALHDRKLELSDIPLVFYYDADVVLNMIMGFEYDLLPEHRRSTPEQRLVRSLLACDYLGPIHMVRPHAFELQEKLDRQKRYADPKDKRIFKQRARQYLGDRGIGETMAELRKIAKKGHQAEDQTPWVDQFIERLRQTAGETFSAIEQINGTWMQRLRRCYEERPEGSLLRLAEETLGPQMKELLREGSEEAEVLRQINAAIRKRRPHRTLNAFQDAAALTMLHLRVRDHEPGQPMVRFYTETGHLKEVCWGEPVKEEAKETSGGETVEEEGRLRHLLSYPTSSGAPEKAGFIFRDVDYFLMRAWFRELAPGRSGEAATLERLEALVAELSELERQEGGSIEQAMERIDVQGKKLPELIEEFEQLALMDSIWVRGRVPEGLITNFDEWTEVFAFARGEATRPRLFQEIDDIQGELRDRVAHIRSWSEDFETIYRAAEARRKQVKGRIREPMRDLGLVRWGYELTNEEQERLVNLVQLLIQDDDSDLSVEASGVASLLEQARQDVRVCLLVCALLWAISCRAQVVELVDECAQAGADLPPSLRVIRAAAKMRSDRASDQTERETLVGEMTDLLDGVSPEERRGILLGVGYVLYHAWKLEMTAQNPRPEWARRSYEVGEEAVKTLPAGGLARAFALNHCTYVGIVTGVEPEKTDEYYGQFLALENTPVWHHRFDDTVGFYYLSEIKEKWEDTPEADRGRLDLDAEIAQAEAYFGKAATEEVGDIDVAPHYNELNRVKRTYQKAKLASRASS